MTSYRATFHTRGTVTAYIDLPDNIDPDEAEDLASEAAWELASEHISTWGITRPVLLDMTLDGIGAESIELAP